MDKIVPLLWFNDKAEEAVNFYVSVFANSKIEEISRYGEAGPGPEGEAMMIEFVLEGQPFKALNGFTEIPEVEGMRGIALFMTCETPEELDRVWDGLLQGGSAMQCGWLSDKYGFAWNIVPKGWEDYLGGDDAEGAQRAMRAMMGMVKLDIDALRAAYEGR